MKLCNSWVAINRDTDLAVWEFYTARLIKKINTAKYYVLRTDVYLGRLNRQINHVSTSHS